MAQTAVQQLVNYMQENFHLTDESLIKFEEALQMEKEQMIDFAFNTYYYISGIMKVPFNQISENKKHAEDNYTRLQNETYGNNQTK